MGAVTFVVVCALVVAITALTHRGVRVDEETFPDAAFRAYVSKRVDVDHDGLVSNDEAIKLVSLNVSGAQNLDGIGSFPNLQSVQATGDQLTSVDLSGLRKLQRADFSGATNLTSLALGHNSALGSLDISNTSIVELDLAGAPNLSTLRCDTDVSVANAPTRKTALVERYDAREESEAGSSETVVEASYDDDGDLVHRELSGASTVSVDYTYDDLSRPTRVRIDDDSGTLTKEWNVTYGDNGRDVHASTGSGDSLDRTYDDRGRITAFSLKTAGIAGYLDIALSYEYDLRGMLSAITLESDGTGQRYVTSYDGEGNLLSLTGDDEVYSYNDGMVAAPVAERSDGAILNREYERNGTSARITELRYDLQGSLTSRADGDFRYDRDEGYLVWGSVEDTEGDRHLVYDVESENYKIPLDHVHVVNSAVDFRYLVAPDAVCDYWLPGDVHWVLDQEICSIARSQDRSLVADGNLAYRESGTYLASDSCYDGLIASLGEDERHLFYDLDGDDSDELVVSRAGSAGEVDAVYTLVGDVPVRCLEAGEGETLSLSSEGFLVQVLGDRDQARLLHFNGLTFDDAGVAGQAEELGALYPALRGLEWA